MNKIMSEIPSPPLIHDEEIDLADILHFMQKNFIALAICILLGIAGGIAVYSYLPAKWQADITLQIGKMPILQKFDYIEPPVEVVQKIKSPLFLSKMISFMYGKDFKPDSPTAKMLYKDLKVAEVKGSNLVKINVFGWTADEAYKNAGILADQVIAEHRKIAAFYLARMQKRLTEVIAEIAQNREVLTKVDAITQNAPSRNESNALLKLALISAKASEIQKLKTEQVQLEEMISATALQPTHIVGRSLVPQTPASPKLSLLLIGGAFIGFLLGLLLSFLLFSHRRGLHGLYNLKHKLMATSEISRQNDMRG